MNACVKMAPESHNDLIVYKEKRPWGHFQKFTENVCSTVKIITVEPRSKLSLQHHMLRDEFWKVIAGECKITVGGKIYHAKKGDEFLIYREVNHRIETGDSKAEVLEISFGDEFSEDDIIRIDDEYGRTCG